MATARISALTTSAAHYQGVRRVYETALFYSAGPYNNWLCSAVLGALNLRPGHSLADVGGGSGMFASLLKECARSGTLAVIEPSAEMLEGAEQYPGVNHAVCADAGAWAAGDSSAGAATGGGPPPSTRFDRILLKEVVHHLGDAASRQRVLRDLREQRLSAGGMLAIVTRPQRDIDYPFFPAAREVWAANQPDERSLVDELQASGYTDVRVERVHYPCELPIERWCKLVQGRFWSTFNSFDDAELAAGCDYIRATLVGSGSSVASFEDRLLLITAVGPTTKDDSSVQSAPVEAEVEAEATTAEGAAAAHASCELAPAAWPIGVRYARDGFVSPVRVLSTKEAEEAHAALAAVEADAEGGKLSGDARFKLHVLYPWAARLVRHPRLLEAVCSALGTDDVLVWSTDLNAKDSHSAGYFTPHQDSTYANLTPADGALTAWVALSDAPSESGCLIYARGSHLCGQLPHETEPAGAATDNMLALGQRVPGYDGVDGVDAPLRAGEASLHAFRTVHWSAPNRTAHRRVGLAIRYVAASIARDETRTRAREMATHVGGEYDTASGAFDLEPAPRTEAGEAEQRVHAEAMERERANYFVSSESGAGSGPGVSSAADGAYK